MPAKAKLFVVIAALSFWGACSGDTGELEKNAGNSADAEFFDAGADATAADDGGRDAGDDVGADAGPDAGSDPDIGDADTDAGSDAGSDAAIEECGNAVIEGSEICDDGNTAEDDACRNDCTPTCGDGVLGSNEACDIAIADGASGACPVTCDDSDSCTTNTLQGSACAAQCVYGAIAACADGDGCCPGTCDATNDNDCAPMCGNGVVEAGELCDGDCRAACDDGMACTQDVLVGSAASCDAACTSTAIAACTDGDGCCPSTCDSTTDNDCSPSCGNAVVESGETCDGNCPASCDDADACTADALVGSAAQCTAMCTNTALGCVAASDGCCPVGCDASNDGDCVAACGNGIVEGAEQCDDGDTTPGDGCDGSCNAEAVHFRLADLDLRDPHVYARLPIFGCTDITDSVPFNLAPSVNQMLQDAIQCDGDCADASDDDGNLDVSFLLAFSPLSLADGSTGALGVFEADCTAPMSSTTCSTPGTSQATTYTSATSATCLEALAGTLHGYTPAVDSSTAPCFGSDTVTLTVDVGGIVIPLQSVQVGGTYVGNPPTTLSDGLLRGFLSEAAADAIILPASISVVGGAPLSSVLPGGDPPASGAACGSDADCPGSGETCLNGTCSYENCAQHSDLDVGLDGTTPGWWFYFNFPAGTVTFTP